MASIGRDIPDYRQDGRIIDARGIMRQPSYFGNDFYWKSPRQLFHDFSLSIDGIAFVCAFIQSFTRLTSIVHIYLLIIFSCGRFLIKHANQDKCYSLEIAKEVNGLLTELRPSFIYVTVFHSSNVIQWFYAFSRDFGLVCVTSIISYTVFLSAWTTSELPLPGLTQLVSAVLWALHFMDYCFTAFQKLYWYCINLQVFLASRFGQTWSHNPIDLPITQIRLLRLHPWRPFCCIRADIVHVNLEDLPQYHAISYTWGKAKDERSILINDYRYDVPIAAYNALSSVSSFWRSQYFWIDSICINQKDIIEKSKQVGIMREIYQGAQRVVICIARSVDSLTFFIFYHDLLVLVLGQGYSSRQLLKRFESPFCWSMWLAWINFFNSEWFKRIWIVQEVALAADIHVKYDGFTYSWDDLIAIKGVLSEPELAGFLQMTTQGRKAVSNMMHMSTLERIKSNNSLGKTFEPIFQASRTPWLRALAKLNGRDEDLVNMPSLSSLRRLLHACKDCEATDPKDRIFALLGLVQDSKYTGLPIPNYDKSITTAAVFQQAAEYILQTHNPFELLIHAAITKDPELGSMPSWVPDWTSLPPGIRLGESQDMDTDLIYRACGMTLPNFEVLSDEGLLKAEGAEFDEIAFVSSPFPSQCNDNEFDSRNGYYIHEQELKDMFQWHSETINMIFTTLSDPYPYTFQEAEDEESPMPTPLIEAFWRTLVGDNTISQRPAPPIVGLDYLAWLTIMNEQNFYLNSDAHGRQLPNTDEFWQRIKQGSIFGTHMARGIVGRSVCITKRGYIGCVPTDSLAGDEIVILLGARAPFVVRQVRTNNFKGQKNHEHTIRKIVGECYVHGIMDGQYIETDPDTTNMNFN